MKFTFIGVKGQIPTVVNWPTAFSVPGQSAYEAAVENGFIGTEAEWIASLGGTVSNKYTEIDWVNGIPSVIRKYENVTKTNLLSTSTLTFTDGLPTSIVNNTDGTIVTTSIYWSSGLPINITKA